MMVTRLLCVPLRRLIAPRPWLVPLLLAPLLLAFSAGPLRGPMPVAAQACTWTGKWKLAPGAYVASPLTLTQTGSKVTGDDGSGDLFSGTVSGSQLTGSWSHGSDNWAVSATILGDCNGFTGTIGANNGNGPSVPFNGSRVGGSSSPPSTPPPPTGGQTQDLGGINWTSYCQSIGDAGASLDGGTINDWHCVETSGQHDGIDVGAACRALYGPNASGQWTTFSDPNTWACYGPGFSTAPPANQPSAGGCTAWNGTWDTDFGAMRLATNGGSVSGTYDFAGGKITGSVSGNTLTGTWSQQPSYRPPNDAGDVQFTLNADGSFIGYWRYDSAGDWQPWNGICTS